MKIIAGLLAVVVLSGCAFLRGNPVPPAVPPAPEVAAALGENPEFLRTRLQRNEQGEITGYKALSAAQEVVALAEKDATAVRIAPGQIAQAKADLIKAEAAWQQIKSAPLTKPRLLAIVDHHSYMATRWAQIALAEAGVEAGLYNLAEAQRGFQVVPEPAAESQTANRLSPARSESQELAGKQLVPGEMGDVRFAPGTARLTGDSTPVVRQLMQFMSANPDYGLRIAGHTDSEPPSSRNLRAFLNANPDVAGQNRSDDARARAYNLDMSRRRAGALATALLEQGVARQRLSVEGFGQSEPIADNATAAGRRENRRVTVTVVPLQAAEPDQQ